MQLSSRPSLPPSAMIDQLQPHGSFPAIGTPQPALSRVGLPKRATTMS